MINIKLTQSKSITAIYRVARTTKDLEGKDHFIHIQIILLYLIYFIESIILLSNTQSNVPTDTLEGQFHFIIIKYLIHLLFIFTESLVISPTIERNDLAASLQHENQIESEEITVIPSRTMN